MAPSSTAGPAGVSPASPQLSLSCSSGGRQPGALSSACKCGDLPASPRRALRCLQVKRAGRERRVSMFPGSPAAVAAGAGTSATWLGWEMGMRVLVLGGDGFCGWPTSLYLSDHGHDITIVDNLSRRKIDIELEVESLTPIRPISERIRAWKEVSGRDIGFVNLDLALEYDRLVQVLEELRPDAIVHFAEQRAAPYSMRTEKTKRYTVDNNVRATHNLLTALAA